MQSHPRSCDEQTLGFYEAEAPVYAASGRGGVSRHLEGFVARLPTGARVLELGCGDGRDSEAMLALGFDVEPTDGSAEMARHAEQRLGRAVRVMRFDELEAVGLYDAVWANASLLHVPRQGLPEVLTSVFEALRPGGWHFANYKGGGAEGRDSYGRYFNYMTREELATAYARSGPWEILEISEYLGGGYDGRQGPWVAITARRPVE